MQHGQDAKINVNSNGQYVVSDSSGTAVTVATDEPSNCTKTELSDLIAKGDTADAATGAVAEAKARVAALTEAAEDRLGDPRTSSS